MGLGIDRAFKELRGVATDLRQSFLEFIEFGTAFNKMDNAWMVEVMEEIDRWIISHRILPSKRKSCTQKVTKGGDFVQPHKILKAHPVLCGMTMFEFLSSYRTVGLRLVNRWPSAVCAVHLYRALRQKREPIIAWPDGDHLINIHTAGQVFLNYPPRSIKECFVQLTVSCGLPLTMYAPDRRSDEVCWKAPRGIGEPSPLLRSLQLNGLVTEPGKGSLESESNICHFERLVVEQFLDVSESKVSTAHQRKHHQQSPRLSIRPFFIALENGLTQELPKLFIDYQGLWQNSTILMRTLRLGLGNSLGHSTFLCEPRDPRDNMSWKVALEILEIASYWKYGFQHPEKNKDFEHSILNKTGKIMEAFLEKYGDTGLRKMDALLEKLPGFKR